MKLFQGFKARGPLFDDALTAPLRGYLDVLIGQKIELLLSHAIEDKGGEFVRTAPRFYLTLDRFKERIVLAGTRCRFSAHLLGEVLVTSVDLGLDPSRAQNADTDLSACTGKLQC